MPGGSVNGRPFRESVDSYSRTGIPCGNPRRFGSHDVVRMEPDKRTASRPIAGPAEAVETEGQRQLKILLQKQMETKTSLQEQLQSKKEFCKAADFRPGTEELVGVVGLREYRSQESSDAYLEEMRAYGLTDEEILYMLQNEGEEPAVKRSKMSNPEYHTARMKEIQDKITQKQTDWKERENFTGVKQLSRHAMEMERTLSIANEQNRFLHKMLIKQAGGKDVCEGKVNDPMKCLPEIVESFSRRRHRRKDHTAGYKSDCLLECCVSPESTSCNTEELRDNNQACEHTTSVATCMERPADFVSKNEQLTVDLKSKKKEPPEKSTSFTVSTDCLGHCGASKCDASKTALRELPYVEPVPEEAIRRYKLSVDQVKKLPRFENYTPGDPTNVLYIKNLSNKVTESDLASLFVRFQRREEERVVFKLLTGRMKGQAFVTLTDVETATRALELVHGYEFKGKPIIIQYGKKITTS